MMAEGFFVSMIRDRRTALLAGPFATHDEALEMVKPAVALACEIDPWAWFDAFGTLKMDTDRRGTLNARLGIAQ